jgi:hypothetical protein
MKPLCREHGVPCVTDAFAYDEATEAFRLGGSQRELMARLFELGMTAAEIRWHAGYPGRRMMVAELGDAQG